MKIAIEALGIHYYGGGRSATLNLLEALFALDTRNEYLVILSQPEPSLVAPAGNVHQWIAPTKNRFALRIWAQMMLPIRLRNYDVVHFIKNMDVFGIRARKVVTVYDMTTLVRPELFPLVDVLYWRILEKHTLRTADRVIAISQTTARDIQRFYGVASDHLRMIYLGCAAHFRPSSPSDIARVRQYYQLPDSCVLHVGRIDRKKNLTMLVEAFALFKKRSGFEGKLVFVGEEYPKMPDLNLHAAITRLGLTSDVIFTGRVPDADLPALYGAATITVFPSLHEGFGLVALEAMSCGAPLIVSPAAAIQEAVGDAAFVLAENKAGCLADALERVIGDADLRAEIRARGLTRAQRFSWAETARQTLQVYEELAAHDA
jgi:glycosyltransferase involved in cell wall biosynthesis